MPMVTSFARKTLRFCLLLATTGSLAWAEIPPKAQSLPTPAVATASDKPATPAVPWLYRGSDIPVDPAWTFGELPNGLRYAVRRNGVPPGQVSIRIAIDAGSLMEDAREQGFAHFLEHLSFRGSRYVADGEAKRVWQRLGATFGSDSNAETSPTQTVFRLDLPQANETSLDESLHILSGMMAAPTISQAEVDAERRTVMAEARERDGAQLRLQNETFRLFFAGQLLAERMPIGTPETLASATPESLRAFHDRWYRPDNSVIAISGDVDPTMVSKLIGRHFGDWKPASPAKSAAALFGAPKADAPTSRFLVEPALPTAISLAWVRPWTAKADTIALNQGRLVELVASRILNRRLEYMARAGSSFLEAEVQQDDVARSADVTQVAITPLGQDWSSALRDVRSVIADAIATPPTQAEVDRETSEFVALLDVQVETARAEPSAKQADNLIEAVNIRETIASPEVARDVFSQMVGKFSPEDVRKATARLFSGIGPRALVNSQMPEVNGAATLAQALSASPMPRRAVRDQSSISFDQLPNIGPPGSVVARHIIPVIEADMITLSNGVRVLLGPSTSEAGRIYVSARFGRGLAGLPKDRVTPVWSSGALIATGIGPFKQDALERLTSGRQISLSMTVGEDAYALRGMTRPADLADQLKLMAAKFAAPGWDPAPVLRTRAAAVLALQTASSSPSEVLARELAPLLRAGDARWATPKKSDAEALTPEAFRLFWEPIFATGPIELSIFGDFEKEAALKAILSSFGALPPRPALPDTRLEKLNIARPNMQPVRLTHKGAADQAIAVLSWPTGGGLATMKTGRQLDILAAIFNDRLFEQFREADGASYSPDVSSSWPQSSSNGGTMTVMAQIKPDSVDAFFSRARKIARDLTEKPVTPDELQRAVGPMLQRLSRASTGNAFWLSQLSGATRQPLRITNLLSWRGDIEKLTPRDIQALAKLYLKPNKSFSLIVTPEKAS